MENYNQTDEMQQIEIKKRQKEALDNYLSQFNSKKEIILEQFQLNTYSHHLNIKLWHLEAGDPATDEEHHEDEEELSNLVGEAKVVQDNTLSQEEDLDYNDVPF